MIPAVGNMQEVVYEKYGEFVVFAVAEFIIKLGNFKEGKRKTFCTTFLKLRLTIFLLL